MNGFAIVARDLEMRFSDDSIAIRSLSFSARAGQIYCIVGPNGAGKTTLLKIAMGTLVPSKGCVWIHDHEMGSAAARMRTAYIPEQVALYRELTALENLEYFLRLCGNPKAGKSNYATLLEAVGLRQDAHAKRLKGFSKGMRQKVALAAAIGKNADVLLLDEPMSGLDPRSTRELLDILNKQRCSGKTVLMVSHDLSAVADIADVVGFMHLGTLRMELERQAFGETPLTRLSELYYQLSAGERA